MTAEDGSEEDSKVGFEDFPEVVLKSSPEQVLRSSLKNMAPRNDYKEKFEIDDSKEWLQKGSKENSKAAIEKTPKNFSKSFLKTN